jgi:uncharacterized membrane protein YsdA (DUF1294 family)/cold shock CspA family protein
MVASESPEVQRQAFRAGGFPARIAEVAIPVMSLCRGTSGFLLIAAEVSLGCRQVERAAVQCGTIIEWESKRSFGFADSDGRRVFLHISNFAERARWPEKGDEVRFQMGTDGRGRPCAQQIVLVASGSVLHWTHWVEIALLMGLPAIALPGLADFLGLWWVLFCVVLTSGLCTLLLWLDKKYAIQADSRVPEATLHLLELFGGWPGSFVAQRVLRHKISKGRYQWVFWLIVLCHQLFALDLIWGGLLNTGLHELVPRWL